VSEAFYSETTTPLLKVLERVLQPLVLTDWWHSLLHSAMSAVLDKADA